MNKKTLIIITGIALIILSATIILFTKLSNSNTYETSLVERGNLVQEITASGQVESPTKIDLHFKNNGKLSALNVNVGEIVVTGQLIAKQDTTQLDAQVLEMQTGIDLQKAKLNQLLGGAANEDIELSKIKLENARRKLYSDDLIAVSRDELRRDSVPIITGSYNGMEEGSYKLYFRDYNDLFNRHQISFIGLEKGTAEMDDLPQSLGTKGLSIAFPEDSYRADDRWTIDIPNKNGANYVSNLNAYNSALAELTLKESPARSTDIAVYQAQIEQAEASLQKIQAQRSDYMIFAPSTGIITEVNGEVGEIITPDKTVVSLGSGGALQIKLNIVEDNIVNVQIGQEARITFDAMGAQEFYGKVAAINPAETIIGGAIYYQTTIVFDENDERIRSGMTANVWIKTAASEDTLYIPVSALQYRDGVKIVKVLEGNNILERKVVTGIKNNYGLIEIISGLSENEQVLLNDQK